MSMFTILVLLSFCVVFLGGTLVLALVISKVYGDSSASYRLFAVRDHLVRLDVEGTVASDDPWFNHTYEQVNSLLQCSYMLGGTKGWVVANKVGRRVAERKLKLRANGRSANSEKSVGPSTPPPRTLVPALNELDEALDQLLNSHFGWHVLFSSAAREYQRLYKKRARELDDTITRGLQMAH
jgi:hypothetical protein